jgi:hypothetical protein
MRKTIYIVRIAVILIAVVALIWWLFIQKKSVNNDLPCLISRYIDMQSGANEDILFFTKGLIHYHDADYNKYDRIYKSSDRRSSMEDFLLSVASLRQGDLDQAVQYAAMALDYNKANMEMLLYAVFIISCTNDNTEWVLSATENILNNSELDDFPNNAIKLFFAGEKPVFDSNETNRDYQEMYEFIDWMKDYIQLHGWEIMNVDLDNMSK